MQKKSLLIAGAGISGLMAANLLADTFTITILEARATLGGRIDTQTLEGHIIEMGPEFVHGNLPVSLGLLKQAGIETKAVDGEMLYFMDGEFTSGDYVADDWDALLNKMGSLDEDMTLNDFLSAYFPNQPDLTRQAVSYAEGFDLADAAKASVKKLHKEWQAEDETNYRIPAGYQALVEYLHQSLIEKGVRVLTNKIVKQVDWETDEVMLCTADEEKFYADKLLITIPVAVLAKTDALAGITFNPPLEVYHTAAQQIGYGNVLKIMLVFTKAFWKSDTGFIISDQVIPTWWTQAPLQTPVLTGWLGGPSAMEWTDKPAEAILTASLQSLATIFSTTEAALRDQVLGYKIGDPQQNDFAMGGYSYATTTSAAAIKTLNTPVADKVFFAGEALYDGPHPGTVEAALVSAQQVAKTIQAVK